MGLTGAVRVPALKGNVSISAPLQQLLHVTLPSVRSLDSYQKAIAAQKQGLFDEEIAPLKVKFTDPKTKKQQEITVSRDDGVREVTVESLGKIKPAFAKNGSIHAGNASGWQVEPIKPAHQRRRGNVRASGCGSRLR